MNSTDRVSNRLLLAVTGLLLLAAGVVVGAATLHEPIRRIWDDVVATVQTTVDGWLRATPVPGSSTSWVSIGFVAALALLIVVLLVFVFRQGRGRSGVVIDEARDGGTIVDAAVAERLLEAALEHDRLFVASHVSTYRVRRAPALKVAVTCRRGVSPREAAEVIEGHVRALDAALGRRLPVFVQLSGGFRARLSSATRTTG